MYDEPPKSDRDRSLVSASSPPASDEGRTTIEDKEGVSFPSILVDNRFCSYLGSAALVVLILGVVALALILPYNDQQTAYQEKAREPMTSPTTPTADGKGEGSHQSVQQAGDEQNADDEGYGRLLGQQASPPDRGAEDGGGAGRVGQTGQGQSGPGWTGYSSEPAIISWSPTIIAVAPITSTKPSATQNRPAPTTVESAPATVNASATTDPLALISSTAKPVPDNTQVATAEPGALTPQTTSQLQRTQPTEAGPGTNRRALP